MQQRNIIIFISILFIACSVWLFAVSSNYTHPDKNKNWWVVYFSDPHSDSLDFTIDNHSDQTDFQWTMFSGQEILDEGQVQIEKSRSLNIFPEPPADFSGHKIRIEISGANGSKTLIRNFK